MKFVSALLVLIVAAEPAANPKYFRELREVQVTAPNQQNYFVVDAGMWAHARANLADLRIYSGDAQIPYALTTEESSAAMEQHPARVLNLGAVGNETHFDLDIEGLAEYDRVQLRLSATNFVATASVDGSEKIGQPPTTHLGSFIIYDFSKERLGSNFVLHLPASTFRYLHVRISHGVVPKEVLTAQVSYLRESKAVWISAGSCSAVEQRERETVITCNKLPGTPLSRLLFDVPGESFNFRRTVTVADAKGEDLVRGSISRICMETARPPVVAEDLAIQVPCGACKAEETHLRVTVDNGDDPPLAGLQVLPQTLEQRVYFDPQGHSDLSLYYGDEKLGPPVYDFAKFFKAADGALPAQLGPELGNPLFQARPDERPWSERHPSVLWIALLVAVAVLGGIAIRSMMSADSPKAG
jgi:hypothetical protein